MCIVDKPFHKGQDEYTKSGLNNQVWELSVTDKCMNTLGLNIFYLYTLYIEQHIKTYNNIQYTNGIQKKVFRRIRNCIPFKISFNSFYRDLKRKPFLYHC